MNKKFFTKDTLIVLLIAFIWVNVSELLRFALIVAPAEKVFLSSLPNLIPFAPINIVVWALFDTVLTIWYVYVYFLCANTYGSNNKSILLSSLTTWVFFLLFWAGLANQNISGWKVVPVVFLFAYIETFVTSWIANKMYSKRKVNFNK